MKIAIFLIGKILCFIGKHNASWTNENGKELKHLTCLRCGKYWYNGWQKEVK